MLFFSLGDLMNDKINLKITSSLPAISGNFEEIKQLLSEELKQFDLIVDANSVKVAKAMATKINKLSGRIDALRKEEVVKLSAPIDKFEAQMKSLKIDCEASRQKLLSQVKVFDDKERAECKKRLDKELTVTYKKYDVKEEFQTVQIADLAIISNLNKSGLAKKAVRAVDERVLEVKQFQEMISTRLLTLEVICLKGGLSVILTRENINHFLMEKDEDKYLKKLVKLIQNEVSRLELANEQKREQQTIKEIAKIVPPITPAVKPIVESITINNQKFQNFKNVNEFKKPLSKRTYTVTATFEVDFDVNSTDILKKMLILKFAKAKFKTVPNIHVEETRYVS